MVLTLRWVVDEVVAIYADARSIDQRIVEPVASRVESARALLEIEPIASASGLVPDVADLFALQGSGRPWSALAEVARELRRISSLGPEEIANQLLLPDPELRWRLFHLGILGKVLVDMSALGCEIESLRPLSSVGVGPSYRAKDAEGRTWDVWFEAGSLYSYYDLTSPYSEATRAVKVGSKPLQPDIVLVRAGEVALFLECKYSADPSTVSRGGFQQAAGYAVEAMGHLAPRVASFVVGPQGVVEGLSDRRTLAGTIGATSPECLIDVIHDLFDAD